MKVGFDLDGTLDKPAIAALANALLAAGHEVHIITGIFDEAGDWQSERAKRDKLGRLGVPFKEVTETPDDPYCARIVFYHTKNAAYHAQLHMLHAVPESFPLDYRLRDLGLRKGALSESLGLDIFLDDSDTYMKMMPAMDGRVTLLHVQ